MRTRWTKVKGADMRKTENERCDNDTKWWHTHGGAGIQVLDFKKPKIMVWKVIWKTVFINFWSMFNQ